MRIKVIWPVPFRPKWPNQPERKKNWEATKRFFGNVKEPDTNLEIVRLSKGATSLEYYYNTHLNDWEIIQEALKAQSEGFDGVIISCYLDPAVLGAKEVLDIPLLGIFEPSAYLASLLGRKFSIVTFPEDAKLLVRDLIALHGLEGKVASVRAINIRIPELVKYRATGELTEVALVQARKAVEEDGADVIVIGSGGMYGIADVMSAELGVPVIDSVKAAVKMIELLIKSGLSQSKKAFPTPSKESQAVES